MNLTLQPVRVGTGSDEEGLLVFDDDQRLVAVLTHLGDQYGEVSGHWYLEASFGRLDGGSHRPSPTWTWYRRGLTNAWRLPDNRALPIKELEHLPSLLGSDDDQLP